MKKEVLECSFDWRGQAKNFSSVIGGTYMRQAESTTESLCRSVVARFGRDTKGFAVQYSTPFFYGEGDRNIFFPFVKREDAISFMAQAVEFTLPEFNSDKDSEVVFGEHHMSFFPSIVEEVTYDYDDDDDDNNGFCGFDVIGYLARNVAIKPAEKEFRTESDDEKKYRLVEVDENGTLFLKRKYAMLSPEYKERVAAFEAEVERVKAEAREHIEKLVKICEDAMDSIPVQKRTSAPAPAPAAPSGFGGAFDALAGFGR